MSIITRCECGNRMSVADVMAGRTVRCSKCGGKIDVPDVAVATAPTPAMRNRMATPAISVSSGMVTLLTVTGVLLVIMLALYLGPWTVGKQWEAMHAKANDQVTDVVGFALEAYESEHFMFDASISHHVPQVQGEASFVPPMMAFSLPRKIIFLGKTSRGNYDGTYDTTNGEVEARIETGGTTVGGLVDVAKATGTFRVTGRVKDGNVEAECDGEPLKIMMRKHEGRE